MIITLMMMLGSTLSSHSQCPTAKLLVSGQSGEAGLNGLFPPSFILSGCQGSLPNPLHL
jgi:hypothetical protein